VSMDISQDPKWSASRQSTISVCMVIVGIWLSSWGLDSKHLYFGDYVVVVKDTGFSTADVDSDINGKLKKRKTFF